MATAAFSGNGREQENGSNDVFEDISNEEEGEEVEGEEEEEEKEEEETSMEACSRCLLKVPSSDVSYFPRGMSQSCSDSDSNITC